MSRMVTGAAEVEVLSGAFAAAVGAAVLAGALRGFSGFGSALVLAPTISALYGPRTAVPVALLLELLLSVPFVPPALRLVDRRRVAILCAAALVAIPAGAALLVAVDEDALRVAICAMVLVAAAVIGLGWRYHGRPSAAATAVTGGLSGLHLSVPAQVFGHADERERYELRVCGAEPGPVASSTGFAIVADHGPEALAWADTVIVPGVGERTAARPPAVLDALRAADARGARIVSICTGAFVLAEAGLLDGRRAATHWRDAPTLAERHAAVEVDSDVLWVDDGRVLTSAGVAAGIDLCLHLVRKDLGTEHANRIARRMVVAPYRAGGQAQFVEQPVPEPIGDGLGATCAWMLEHLDEPLTVPADGAARRAQRAFLRAALPVGDGHHPAALVARAAGASRPSPPGGDLAPGRGDRPPRGLRHVDGAADALPARDAHHADRLPAGVHCASRSRTMTSPSPHGVARSPSRKRSGSPSSMFSDAVSRPTPTR